MQVIIDFMNGLGRRQQQALGRRAAELSDRLSVALPVTAERLEELRRSARRLGMTVTEYVSWCVERQEEVMRQREQEFETRGQRAYRAVMTRDEHGQFRPSGE